MNQPLVCINFLWGRLLSRVLLLDRLEKCNDMCIFNVLHDDDSLHLPCLGLVNEKIVNSFLVIILNFVVTVQKFAVASNIQEFKLYKDEEFQLLGATLTKLVRLLTL